MRVGIDPEVLRMMVGDDPEAIRGAVEDFLLAARAGIAEIRAAAASGQSERVKISSHKLKGSSRLVGAEQLAESCARLEAAGHMGDWQVIGELLPRMDRLLSELEASAEALLRQGTA